MKYCSMCGNQLNDNARFCIACGSKVQEEIANEKVPGKKGKVIKIKPRGKKSAREIAEIVIMVALLCVVGAYLTGLAIQKYADYQFEKFSTLINESNYSEADEINEKLNSDFFKKLIVRQKYEDLKIQLTGEEYISDAFTEFKENYLDDSYIPIEASLCYTAVDYDDVDEYYEAAYPDPDTDADADADSDTYTGAYSRLQQNLEQEEQEIADRLANAVEELYLDFGGEQREKFLEYYSENSYMYSEDGNTFYNEDANIFADIEDIVLVIEYGQSVEESSGYAIFTYNPYEDKYELFGTCDTIDRYAEDAGDIGKLGFWVSTFDDNDIYVADSNRLTEMLKNGAFSD